MTFMNFTSESLLIVCLFYGMALFTLLLSLPSILSEE